MDGNVQRALALESALVPVIEHRIKFIQATMVSEFRSNKTVTKRLYAQVAAMAELESLKIDLVNDVRRIDEQES